MTSVKTTSLNEWIISLLAPHHCFGCKKEGELVCEGCVATALLDKTPHCYICEQPTSVTALCRDCRGRSPMADVFVGGAYDGLLERLLYAYKFERARSAHVALGRIMDEALPYLLDEAMIVPIPTAPRRLRVRGYDQTELLARYLMKQRGIHYVSMLQRKHQKRQLGASRKVRAHQAATAFGLKPRADVADKTIIVIDDVLTTGATLQAAAKILRSAGAAKVYGLVVAQQLLQ